ncbi:MAG: carbohydrate-binding family 9-like protein [Clostridia bacterium]|nr:carbohydrate-binding family 9-like protein [Clostridia bacterium]
MSVCIKRQPLVEADKIVLDKIGWGFTEYTPYVYAKIAYETGFDVEFYIKERDPMREKTEHFQEVCEDSCVEFFVKFDPENSDEYFNFEVNANGTMLADIRTDRYNYRHLTLDEIASLNITPDIQDDHWTVRYKIGMDLIKKYYPCFDIHKCKYVEGNLYKCGSKTKVKHYMTLFDVKCENPDFHRPEYFGAIELA